MVSPEVLGRGQPAGQRGVLALLDMYALVVTVYLSSLYVSLLGLVGLILVQLLVQLSVVAFHTNITLRIIIISSNIIIIIIIIIIIMISSSSSIIISIISIIITIITTIISNIITIIIIIIIISLA